MARLQDKVALITGGESGIGLATARLFVSEGARVHLVGIDEAKLASAVEELGEDHALSSVGDVTDEHAVMQAVAEGEDRYGRLDIVVSNAGISGEVSEIVDYPSDVFARTLAVHVLSAFHILKHTIPRIPGPTSTAFQDDIEMRATGQPRDEAAKVFDALVPLGRHTTPEEIAHGMLYLAADESAMVTSHTFSIDGGLSG